jgi:hypothetical protein
MTPDLDELLPEALARFTADVHAPAGLVPAARRRRRRRLAIRASLTAGTAATVVAAAVIATGTGGAATGQPVQTTAYVLRQVESALAAANHGQVMYARSTPGVFAAEINWSYLDSGSNEHLTNGQVTQAGNYRFDPAGSTLAYTEIDYWNRTWYQGHEKLSGPDARGVVSEAIPATAVNGTLLMQPPACQADSPWLRRIYTFSWPGYIGAMLSCGGFRDAGPAVLSGHRIIKLVSTSAASSAVKETLWVSPQTYLPVRMTAELLTDGIWQPMQTDFEWLPPTAANIAKTQVAVPAGFRKVPAPATPRGS